MLGESEKRRADGAVEGDIAAAGAQGRPGPAAARISCIVCAYNEADRIRHILSAVRGHPALAEVIVVNDGSTDETEALLADEPGIRLISYAPNQGKTHAMGRGIAAATSEYIMLLDADLCGISPGDIQALADPVLQGRADVSISLRSNSLALYRALGIDFVSGERVIPASLVKDAPDRMSRLPRWGGEVFINSLVIRQKLSIAVVDWPRVLNIRKYRKVGLLRGFFAEMRMVGDAFRVLSPWGTISQNLALLSLVKRGAANRRRSFNVVHQVLPKVAPDEPV